MREGQKRDSARSLRCNATDAERIMLRLLRDRRLDNIKFRRQVPIGRFVADFASIEHWLENDWRVLRFWNNEAMSNRDGVLEMILQAVALTPTLSRKRERK